MGNLHGDVLSHGNFCSHTPRSADVDCGAQDNYEGVLGLSGNLDKGPTSGNRGSWTGLEYVTVRPKQRNQKGFCSNPVDKTPDLNEREDSDPFDLNDIIQRTARATNNLEEETNDGDYHPTDAEGDGSSAAADHVSIDDGLDR
ncbi:hypothetical protein Hanom_Chr03g00183561 [Helianthus anomalus]